jgi:hypothetical protein
LFLCVGVACVRSQSKVAAAVLNSRECRSDGSAIRRRRLEHVSARTPRARECAALARCAQCAHIVCFLSLSLCPALVFHTNIHTNHKDGLLQPTSGKGSFSWAGRFQFKGGAGGGGGGWPARTANGRPSTPHSMPRRSAWACSRSRLCTPGAPSALVSAWAHASLSPPLSLSFQSSKTLNTPPAIPLLPHTPTRPQPKPTTAAPGQALAL